MATYSQVWYDTFLRGVPQEQTEREADFLARVVPRKVGGQVLQ